MPRPTILELASLDVADFEGECVTCPAGSDLNRDGAPACFCGIEQSVVSSAIDPDSFLGYCTGDGSRGRPGYMDCPTWRTQREREWEAKGRKVA